MNRDRFEQKLQQQSFRGPPPEWRAEILRQAGESAQRPAREPLLRRLLWPCPEVWAGIAAIWIAILFLNRASQDAVLPMASAAVPVREIQDVLQEKQRLYAELTEGAKEVKVEADRPKFIPKPRTERMAAIAC